MILGYYLYYFAEFLFLNCSSGEIYEPGESELLFANLDPK